MSYNGLGDAPASNFAWQLQSWYYLYAWTVSGGWNNGQWVLGEALCRTISGPLGFAEWFAIFNWPANQVVLFDSHKNTFTDVCLNMPSS